MSETDLPPPSRPTPPPGVAAENPESRPSVSLGPLGLIGFGPKPDSEAGRSVTSSPGGVLVTAAALVVLVAALKIARPVLVPLVVSAFLATLTAPLVLYLQKRNVPAVLGVPLVILMTLACIAGLTGVVVGSLNEFIQAAPEYQTHLIYAVVGITDRLGRLGLHVVPADVLNLIQPAAAMRLAGEMLSELANFLSSALLILLLTVFVLFEALVLPDKLRRALGDPHADFSQGIRVVQRVKAYVVVKTGTSLATGLIIGGVLYLMGVDFALLWGLLAFLLNFIPNIGSIIAAVPAIILSWLQLGVSTAIVTGSVFLAVNMVIGSLLEPRIMGQRMNLSPLIVFVSLVFWGWLWGPLGMLLSVPLTMVLRILLDGNEGTKPFAILMAGARPDDMETASHAEPPARSPL